MLAESGTEQDHVEVCGCIRIIAASLEQTLGKCNCSLIVCSAASCTNKLFLTKLHACLGTPVDDRYTYLGFWVVAHVYISIHLQRTVQRRQASSSGTKTLAGECSKTAFQDQFQYWRHAAPMLPFLSYRV